MRFAVARWFEGRDELWATIIKRVRFVHSNTAGSDTSDRTVLTDRETGRVFKCWCIATNNKALARPGFVLEFM
jgi:hypothetical protein